MKNREKINFLIRTYKNLSIDFVEINAYKKQESLPVHESNFDLSRIGVSELIFSWKDSCKNDISEKMLSEVVINFLEKVKIQFLNFKTENFVAKKNRIRSYKGVYDKKNDTKTSLQHEFDLVHTESTLICGLLDFLPSNYSLIENMISDSDTSFLFGFSSSSLRKQARNISRLEKIFRRAIVFNNVVTINYLSLFELFCSQGELLVRSSGNGNDYYSLQFFYDKKEWSEYDVYNLINVL